MATRATPLPRTPSATATRHGGRGVPEAGRRQPGRRRGRRRAGVARLLQRTQGVDLQAARAAAAAAPDDVDAQTMVADLDMLGGHVNDAFDRLVELVRRSEGDEREPGPGAPVGLFGAVGNDDPRVLRGRQNLASACSDGASRPGGWAARAAPCSSRRERRPAGLEPRHRHPEGRARDVVEPGLGRRSGWSPGRRRARRRRRSCRSGRAARPSLDGDATSRRRPRCRSTRTARPPKIPCSRYRAKNAASTSSREKPQRHLGQVVGAEGEELGRLGDPAGGQRRTRQLDHGADRVERRRRVAPRPPRRPSTISRLTSVELADRGRPAGS